MGPDPVISHHGTRISWSNSIIRPININHNQPGTEFRSHVGIIPTISSLGELLALHISARDIWAHIQIQQHLKTCGVHTHLIDNMTATFSTPLAGSSQKFLFSHHNASLSYTPSV